MKSGPTIATLLGLRRCGTIDHIDSVRSLYNVWWYQFCVFSDVGFVVYIIKLVPDLPIKHIYSVLRVVDKDQQYNMRI